MKKKLSFRQDEERWNRNHSFMPLKRKKLAFMMIVVSLIVILMLSFVINEYGNEIMVLRDDLHSTTMELNLTEAELNKSYVEIDGLIEIRGTLIEQLVSADDMIDETVRILNETRFIMRSANETIVGLRTEIASARNGSSYHLHDPTYAEMKDFLVADPVNTTTYQQGFYVCRHFAKDMKNNAALRGIRSAYVEFYGPRTDNMTQGYTDWKGHCMVGFDTTDRGFIYIEPQSDKEKTVEIGLDYGTIHILDLLIIW